MTTVKHLSRRDFLGAAGAASSAAWLRAAAPVLAGIAQTACSARDTGSVFTFLDESDAADFAAIAARIIPTTDTPGATEAGVIHFIDQTFAAMATDDGKQPFFGFFTPASADPEAAIDGLAALNGEGPRFSALGDAAQDESLRAIEDSAFFGFMRTLTIFGFFAMSEYGGNKNHIGWEVIGFEGHNGAWTYPFGHYDAAVHGNDADD